MLAIAISAATIGLATTLSPTSDPCAGDPSCIRASADQLFAAAASLAADGQYAEAEALLVALTRDPNAEYRSEARFRLAALRESGGDRAGAIAALRELLAEQPDATRARLELGRILAADGQSDQARREFQRAQAAGLPSDVARTVSRFSSLLNISKRRGASVELGVGVDSNVNRSTSSEFVDTVIAPFELDADARRQSGIGISGNVQGYSRNDVGTVTMLSRAAAHADLFPGKTRFNDLQLFAGTGPEVMLGSGTFRPALNVDRRWFGGSLYSSGFGGSASWVARKGRRSQLELAGTATYQRIHTNRLLSGWRYSLSATYDQSAGANTTLRFNLRGSLVDARARPESLKQGSAEMIAVHNLGFAHIFASGAATRIEGRAPLSLFGKTRADERIDLGGGIALRRAFAGFAPLLRATFTRSWSNIEIYDYSRFRIDAGLSREF